MQGVHSNYEIDLFATLIDAAADALGVDNDGSSSLNVIADHIRASAFLIVDGVLKSALAMSKRITDTDGGDDLLVARHITPGP